ncbi:MAG: ParB/RepB/Spo0J family partition protein [Candidatus Kerfeldbacteria bacterium]|nr:ParB/RepB/Spo0J family partition protein [Candidatus Kerfeldbacteria bacterium]
MALGRGLGSLIPPKQSATMHLKNQVETSALADGAQAQVRMVAVGDIVPNPHQPRKHFSHQELENLIQSIKQHGILQPLLVSPTESDGYELIAGERRLRAARIAGLTTVPVLVRNVADLEKIELALIENIQRSDLNPVEKAESYRKLLNEFGLNHDEAAKKLAISRSSFSNTLRLLDLPGDMQKALADGKMTEGHAKILLGLSSEREQHNYFNLIQTDHLSVQRLSQAVSGKTKQQHTGKVKRSAEMVAWEEDLALALGTKVTINPKQVIIQYYSPEELAQIVKKIRA